MKTINFAGVKISAEQYTWKELDDFNTLADEFMQYLGYYQCDEDDGLYALFKDVDDGEYICVALPWKGAANG